MATTTAHITATTKAENHVALLTVESEAIETTKSLYLDIA